MQNNDIPCYECSSGVYRERVMNYIFESEDGERITIPCIKQLVCDQCNDVCISMESFDEIEDYVNKYHIRRAFQERQKQAGRRIVREQYRFIPGSSIVVKQMEKLLTSRPFEKQHSTPKLAYA